MDPGAAHAHWVGPGGHREKQGQEEEQEEFGSLRIGGMSPETPTETSGSLLDPRIKDLHPDKQLMDP